MDFNNKHPRYLSILMRYRGVYLIGIKTMSYQERGLKDNFRPTIYLLR